MPSVLQITDKPSPGGGIRRVVDQHRAMLERSGWHCRELRLIPRGDAAPEGVLTAPIEVALRLPGDAASVRAIRQAASVSDVVHLHLGFSALSPAMVAAAASVAPLVVNLHDVSPFDGLGLPDFGIDAREAASLAQRLFRLRLWPVRRAVWQRICRDAQAIVAPSHYLARLAQAAGAPAARIRVLPHAMNFVDVDTPPPSTCGPAIVYAGYLSDDKGAPLLLEAFSRLRTPKARLIFVGDGPARAAMETSAARCPAISFRGHLRQPEVARAIAEARVLAHPSLVPEGFGLVGIEAMQLGRPVVGFGLGGCGDWLIAGKTGLVPLRHDPAALADCLDKVLADGALADRLGAAGRAHVAENFTTERVAVALVAVLNSVVRLRLGQV